MTPLRENSWKLTPGILQTSPHTLFPFVNIAWYPFTVITLSHYCDYMRNPVSPPRHSLNLEVGSGNPQHTQHIKTKVSVYKVNAEIQIWVQISIPTTYQLCDPKSITSFA